MHTVVLLYKYHTNSHWMAIFILYLFGQTICISCYLLAVSYFITNSFVLSEGQDIGVGVSHPLDVVHCLYIFVCILLKMASYLNTLDANLFARRYTSLNLWFTSLLEIFHYILVALSSHLYRGRVLSAVRRQSSPPLVCVAALRSAPSFHLCTAGSSATETSST